MFGFRHVLGLPVLGNLNFRMSVFGLGMFSGCAILGILCFRMCVSVGHVGALPHHESISD